MEILIVLVVSIGLPVLAAKGMWHRGVYAAFAVVGLLLAVLFGQMPMGINAAAGIRTTEQAQATDAIIMALLATGIGMAIGGLLGACLYQPKKLQAVVGNPPASGVE